MLKYLINLNNKFEKSWSFVDFQASEIVLEAGWYVAEFQLSSSVTSVPRLVVEDVNQIETERLLDGAHSGRNRMMFYLPAGRLKAFSKNLEFERLAKCGGLEARFRIALICLRYLIDFPRPSVFFKMLVMQFQTPFELSSRLLTFYEPARGGGNYLSELEKWRRYQRFSSVFKWLGRGVKIAVVVEREEQEKQLKKQLVAPDFIVNASRHDKLPENADYVISLKHGEELRFASIYLIKRIIAKAKSSPLLLYSDHDYDSQSDEVLPPVFKPQPSLAYLHCYNYIGFAVIMATRLLEDKTPKEVLEHELKYRVALQALNSDLNSDPNSNPTSDKKGSEPSSDVISISEAMFSSKLNTPTSTPQPSSEQSPWLEIEWLRDGDINRLRADEHWQSSLSVDLVIPTRDGLSVLKPCIDSILEKTLYQNYKIIIVDNDSQQQETLDYFKRLEAQDRVSVLHYPGEFNYSAINNFAVAHSKADYIALVNNDVEVISPDWLSQMMSWAGQKGVGVVGAKLLFSNDKVQHAGVTIGMGNAAGHIHRLEDRDAPGYQQRCQATQNMMAVTAACLITPRALFNQLGGLNEMDFKVAYNDIDYCLRVESLAYEVIWTPEALLYHHESVSRGDDMSETHIGRYMKELGVFQRRWKSKGFVDKYYSKHLRITDEGVFPTVDRRDNDDLKYLYR